MGRTDYRTGALGSLAAVLVALSSSGCATQRRADPPAEVASDARMIALSREAALAELALLGAYIDNDEPLTPSFVDLYFAASRRAMHAQMREEPSRAKAFALEHFRRCRDVAAFRAKMHDGHFSPATARAVHETLEAGLFARRLGATPDEIDLRPISSLFPATTAPTTSSSIGVESRLTRLARDAAVLELKELTHRWDNSEPLTLAFTEMYVAASERVMRFESQLDPSRAREFALDHFRRCRDYTNGTTMLVDPPINLATVRGASAAAEAAQHAVEVGASPDEVDVTLLEKLVSRSAAPSRNR